MYQAHKLKARRQALGLRQTDIAERLGISKQSYFAWEKGLTQPNKENLEKVEAILGVSPGYLMEDQISSLYKQLTPPNQTRALTYVKNLLEEEKEKLTVALPTRFEYHVYEKMSAGIGSSIYDDKTYDTVYFDQELAHDFASWVDGNSMAPTYQNGEVALIRETGFDYDGAVYAVVWNDQTYIKKVYCEENGLRLVSINSDYADKFAPFDDNPRVVGKIVGHFMPLEY